jgi:predicted nucleic acid-binding protein
MKLVLDSSVAIKWVLPERDTPKAVRLRNEFRQGAHELLAPDVFPVEVGHALTRAERRGVIRPPAAIKRLNNVLSYPPVLYPYVSKRPTSRPQPRPSATYLRVPHTSDPPS